VGEIPIHRHLPEKDYAPFLLLSGGGVFVYTGQFVVEDADAQTFELRPRPGEFVVVPGHAAREPLRWDSIPDGTYAAFGPVEPVEEERLVAIIDAGFPNWLREEARALLPRLFDHYAAVLGRELPFRPAVLLSYSEDATRPGSISLKGGTLTGLLQQDVQLGSARSAAGDPMVLKAFRQSLAHEAAHLWNSRVIRPRGPDWIHEGGADLLAWRALRALGIYSADQYEFSLSSARSACASLRGSGPLGKAPVKARYACGAAIQAAAPDPDALWAALIRRGGTYDEESFFDLLRLAGTLDEAIRTARTLASDRP
jgi:hypothetical protein